MGRVDAVYFANDWQKARGCRIERMIAREYGIKILDTDFLNGNNETKLRFDILNEDGAIIKRTLNENI